ncbi:hypothetical protein CC80DRAFT_97358 [Byssothecium circinans]|uniref:Uncharacterized protein n=1 Tax=Byssothecium circinans TaxID=147558 RepID=A0A6A5UG72_9PLEO|nr:hypothetical protein CC80DRAFT_97358 [Byssothecium circinans]
MAREMVCCSKKYALYKRPGRACLINPFHSSLHGGHNLPLTSQSRLPAAPTLSPRTFPFRIYLSAANHALHLLSHHHHPSRCTANGQKPVRVHAHLSQHLPKRQRWAHARPERVMPWSGYPCFDLSRATCLFSSLSSLRLRWELIARVRVAGLCCDRDVLQISTFWRVGWGNPVMCRRAVCARYRANRGLLHAHLPPTLGRLVWICAACW